MLKRDEIVKITNKLSQETVTTESLLLSLILNVLLDIRDQNDLILINLN